MENQTDNQVTERALEKRLELDAPIGRVWKAITDPTELSQWFGHETQLDLRPGGDGAMIWREHGMFAVRVDVVEPPTRLVWSWLHEPNVPFRDDEATRVEWVLTSRDDGGTSLYLRESGFRTDIHHGQNTQGWDEELAELVELLST